MRTLYDFGLEVQKVREAINNLTVKGSENASLIVYAIERCNDIIKAINAVAEQQKEAEKGQNGNHPDIEEGEVNGEPDSGAAS